MMWRRTEDGFTLIEMLVALAVFSIAALALLRLDLFAVRQAGALTGVRMASLVIQNEAALAATDPSLTIGESRSQTTNAGLTFDVLRRVTPTDDVRLVRIDLTATERSGNGRAIATMVKRVK